jgi:hypothetical protein
MIRYVAVLLLFTQVSVAQGSLKFSELLTFSHTQNGQPRETSVYLDRKTSTWLFTNDDSFGGTAEGLSFVVAYPNGIYLLCSTDDSAANVCQRFRNKAALRNTKTVTGKPTGKRAQFGANKYGWPVFTGSAYQLQAGRMSLNAHLTTVPFNCYPLYAYNTLLGLEIGLPIFQSVDYTSIVPRNRLVVSEELPDGIRLKNISPTEYFIDLKTYRIADAKL